MPTTIQTRPRFQYASGIAPPFANCRASYASLICTGIRIVTHSTPEAMNSQ